MGYSKSLARIGFFTQEDKNELQTVLVNLLGAVDKINLFIEQTNLQREKDFVELKMKILGIEKRLDELELSMGTKLQTISEVQASANENLSENRRDLTKELGILKGTLTKMGKKQVNQKDMENVEELLRALTVNHFLTDIQKNVIDSAKILNNPLYSSMVLK